MILSLILILSLLGLIISLLGVITIPVNTCITKYLYLSCIILSELNTVDYFIIGVFVIFIIAKLVYIFSDEMKLFIDYYISIFKKCLLFFSNDRDISTFCLILSLFSGLLGTAFSILIRLELSGPGVQYTADNQLYNSIITAYVIFMIFFMVIPALIGGFGNLFFNLIKVDYASSNEIGYFFFIETLLVLGPISYFVRYPINNLIYSIDNLNIISIFILQICFNIVLGFFNFYVFRFIRNYLFPPFIPIIGDIIIYFVVPIKLEIESCVYSTYGNHEFRRARVWIKEGRRYLQVSRKCARQSRMLNTIAPLMDRSGNGGLYDSFTECARSLREKADRYENNAAFLWVNAFDLTEYMGSHVPIHSRSLIQLTGYPQDHESRQWARG